MMKLNNPLERVRNVIQSGMGQPPATAAEPGRTFVFINVDQLDPNPFQPRQNINGPALEELRQSIAEHGVIEPIIVRRKEDRYEIISGERRWRASRELGIEEIPCILKDVSDEESFKLALSENIQRNDLTPLEEALAFKRLMEMKIARTQSDIGKMLGIQQQRVSDKLRLLELPKEVQALFGDPRYQEHFSQKHGEIIGRLKDGKKIREIAARIVEEELSTRETRELVEHVERRLRSRPEKPGKEAQARRHLHVSRSRHGFTLKLSFDKRQDQLEEILQDLERMVAKLRKEFEPQQPV